MKALSLLILMLAGVAQAAPIFSSRPDAWAKLYVDADGAPWTATPQQQLETLGLVARLYAPFNVDVTTVNPGPRTNVAWIVVGGPLQGAIAGRAGVGSWGAGTLYGRANAGEVYADGLNNDPVEVGIAICHEAGHLLGLEHEDMGVMYPAVQSSPAVTWTAGDVEYFDRVLGAAPLPDPAPLVLALLLLSHGGKRP